MRKTCGTDKHIQITHIHLAVDFFAGVFLPQEIEISSTRILGVINWRVLL